MCTRIAELAYAPFKHIGETLGDYVENTDTNTKIKFISLTFFLSLHVAVVCMWVLSKPALPLSTVVATSFVIGFAVGVICLFGAIIFGCVLNRCLQR